MSERGGDGWIFKSRPWDTACLELHRGPEKLRRRDVEKEKKEKRGKKNVAENGGATAEKRLRKRESENERSGFRAKDTRGRGRVTFFISRVAIRRRRLEARERLAGGGGANFSIRPVSRTSGMYLPSRYFSRLDSSPRATPQKATRLSFAIHATTTRGPIPIS